jgi:DNA-binding transcriptional regulator GbsR (MarR family)
MDHNIQYMQNMSNQSLTSDQLQFIDDLAQLLMPWGMPLTTARLYGYLQIRNEPASLDEIAADLQVSKSNACTAAKLLEDHGNARRMSERGTKRVLYVAGGDPGAPLRKQTELLGKMSELIDRRKGTVATGVAGDRMAHLAQFHGALKAAMESVINSSRFEG